MFDMVEISIPGRVFHPEQSEVDSEKQGFGFGFSFGLMIMSVPNRAVRCWEQSTVFWCGFEKALKIRRSKQNNGKKGRKG